ncbi:PrsW family intramembrane metalloprotease [Actinacidiphila sp. ITFR-21]|uniref:PrsW family intramembrane metalloprotease n=1 Tax=Actinacidiphila sp. ITFR-21 TaxID=3075199 RepID=UPI00288A656E|nr:PrsW family intramembrane metalloprotease [Streptomyces sp. ITFR-21]WNI16242.1 PrsW family intramembrane metalloprotease [Streptomyces sp. ITFR-21]
MAPTVTDTPASAWLSLPRRSIWESKAVRTGALFTALAVCGVIILALVRQHIGTGPFLIGLLLAILPVPLLLWAFLWLDHVAPAPWQNVVFAIAWGACAATLVAIFANEYGEKLVSSAFSGTPSQSDHWSATFVAPLVEETAKGTAVLLLFLFRRRAFASIVDGIVLSGLAAAGFAFTENILYLGTAVNEDRDLGSTVLGSTTAATFFVRVLMTPFAHPLFTSMTGIGFAVAATVRPGRRWRWRWAPPLAGWLLAMVLHGTWNGSSLTSPGTFLTVYVTVMLPAFGLVVWLAFWARSNELRTIRTHLPVYAAAGWLALSEPAALGSMSVRATARRETRRFHGDAAARAVRDYTAFATRLAFLRAAATRGAPTPDFATRESELLHHLWSLKPWGRPALLAAALPPPPPFFPPPRTPRWGPPPPYYRPPTTYAPPPTAGRRL